MRELHMSIQGEFINRLALEKCHQDYDICYAVDLLMSCLQTDQISDGNRLMLVLRILNGEVEIRGTYPGDDYGPVELEIRNEKYDLRATLATMKQKLQEKKRETQRLYNMLTCCGERLGDDGMKAVNRMWGYDWGEDGTVFGGVESASELEITAPLGEFLEHMKQPDPDKEYGWLEPSGKFHEVPFGEHQKWAFQKAKELGFIDEAINNGSCGDVLLERGWVLIDNPDLGLGRTTISDTKPLTKAQREFLFNYYTERNRPEIAKEYLAEGR